MAAQAGQTQQLAKLVFWTKPKSSEKDSLVPGVNDLGNMRPRVRGGRTKEIQAVMPVVQPTVEDVNSQSPRPQSLASSSVSQHVLDTALSKQVATDSGQGVSLRNLCVEDKKRVANLIKELARLGEEKENAEKNLEEERQRYEEQILALVAQQEQLLKDYEVQKTLVEYQTYILKLQQQKQHPLKQPEHSQQQAPLPGQQPLHKVSVSHDATNKVRLTENVGQRPRVQGPPTYILATREDLYKDRIDQWQRNLCVNTALEGGVDNCSIEVNPSVSLPVELANTELDLQRPFTAIIDRELAYQRQLLAAAVANSNQECPTVKTVSAVEKADSPKLHPEIFLQKILPAARPNEAVLHRHGDPSQVDLVSQPQNHAVTTGTRHAEYPHLPAEKAEIIARFMRGQAHVLDGGSMQRTTMTTQNHLNSAGNCVDKVIEGERLPARKRAHGAPRGRKRKPPPASYGPLLAPIMSSTQKSSEFGDSLCGNSSVHVDRKLAVRQQHLPRVVDEEVDHVEDDKNCADNVHYHHHHLAAGSRHNNHVKMVHKNRKIEKHDHDRDQYSPADADGEIVDKYKQLSAIEQKTQLLKQRSLLLEEQVKLKKILAEQHYQMQMQRQAALAPTQQTTQQTAQQTAVEKDERAYVEMSLAKLEEEVARKEQELLHERERLERKRQEYAHKEPGDRPQPAYPDTVAGTNRLTSDQESRGAGHQPSMSAHGARPEVEAPLHSSDGSGRRHKQQTRTSSGREVNARRSKVADVRVEEVAADHLPGTVKDAGIGHPSPKVKDVVKKLNYSLNSDTESDVAVNSESLQHSTPASRGGVARVQGTHIVPPTSSQVVPHASSLPRRSDASTSVSFAHVPRLPTESPAGGLKCSTGTEMTPGKSAHYTRMGPGSKPSRQTGDDESPKLSLGRSDRTYTKDHGFVLPEEEMLSDVEIIKLLSEQTPVPGSQQGHTQPSLSKVTNPHDASMKTPTTRSQQLSAKHQHSSLVLIDKFHLVEDCYTPPWNPPAKSKLEHPETDSVLELFEVKRPTRGDTSRQLPPKDVQGSEHVVNSSRRLGAVSRRLDASKGPGSGGDDGHALRDDEMSLEKVIQILNFSSREDVSNSQRSTDIGADVCTEAIADGNADISDEAEDRILEEVFFVRS